MMANVSIMRDADGLFSHYDKRNRPVFHITDDGGVLCPDCANLHGHTERRNDGWRIVASDILFEDYGLTCDYCDGLILAATGNED